MKLINEGVSRFAMWVGEKFTCPATGDVIQFEERDIASIIQEHVFCPSCGNKITFESDQREGHYLNHM